MAMTKKERVEFDAALREARILGALRWTSPIARDVAPPQDGYSEGWDFNECRDFVWLGWSTSFSHGTGPAPKDSAYHSGSQRGRQMFSTKALALAALRHAMELKFAEELVKVDAQLIAEKECGNA